MNDIVLDGPAMVAELTATEDLAITFWRSEAVARAAGFRGD